MKVAIINPGKKPTGYKRTGVLAVDMVAACIDWYGRRGKKLQYIRLEKSKWIQFCAYVQSQIPGYDFSDGTVDFDGVEITQGSFIQILPLYAEVLEAPKTVN